MRLSLLTLASLLLIGATPALAADTGFDEPAPQIERAKDDGGVRPSTADTGPKRNRKTEALGPSEMIPPPTPLSKVLIVDQQRVHMLEAGWDQYEVLILLPGFPDPVVGCQKMMDALAERFHVMAVDPQGFGFSGGPNWVTYSPQGMAQFVLRLMDYLSIEKAHIAGFDLSAGGWLARVRRRIEQSVPGLEGLSDFDRPRCAHARKVHERDKRCRVQQVGRAAAGLSSASSNRVVSTSSPSHGQSASGGVRPAARTACECGDGSGPKARPCRGAHDRKLASVAGSGTFATAATAAIAAAARCCSTTSTGLVCPLVRQLTDQASSTFPSATINRTAPPR